MAIQLTEFARRVFEELQRLKLMLFGVTGDNQALNHRLTESHENAKAAALGDLRERFVAHLPPDANPDDFISYSGENPAANRRSVSRRRSRSGRIARFRCTPSTRCRGIINPGSACVGDELRLHKSARGEIGRERQAAKETKIEVVPDED